MNRGEEEIRVERLRNESGSTERQRVHHAFAVRDARKHEDLKRRLLAHELFKKIGTDNPGHREVENQEIRFRGMAVNEFPRFIHGIRREHFRVGIFTREKHG